MDLIRLAGSLAESSSGGIHVVIAKTSELLVTLNCSVAEIPTQVDAMQSCPTNRLSSHFLYEPSKRFFKIVRAFSFSLDSNDFVLDPDPHKTTLDPKY